MGFYGNITNTARTQFQFDRTYPNRYEMEQKTKTDGIYAGRYILIEYDSDVHLDHMLRVWHKADGWYTQDSNNINILLKEDNVVVGELVYTASAEIDRNDPRAYRSCVFYKCIGFNDDPNKTAKFEEVVDGSSDPNTPTYTVNYNIDTNVFGAGRGYDSTVWQKTYSAESGEKYVMIAELNTVVPTFAVTPDAPTMNPVVPHFDTQSTDVYYKLHWQAPWGFRMKEAAADESDEDTTHTTTTYNPGTGKNSIVTREGVPAAIYFNEVAFNAQVDEERESEVGINKHSNTVTLNEIKVEPTGKSGNKYNDHTGASTESEQVDIQEMTINLPAIGNMMSDAWDIIHGPYRNNDRRDYLTDSNGGIVYDENNNPIRVDSLKGRLNSFEAFYSNQIPVKRAEDGTIVGSHINGANNYVLPENTDILSVVEDNANFASDDAWIKTVVDSASLKSGDKNDALNNQNNNNGIAIHHTFHPTANSISSIDKNTGVANTSDSAYKTLYIPAIKDADGETVISASNSNTGTDDTIKVYTPYVDATGHVVGHNIETVTLPYGFKTITTNGRSDEVSENATGTPVTADVVADTTQATLKINSGNKWVRIDTDAAEDGLTIRHDVHTFNDDKTDSASLSNETSKTVTFDTTTYDFDNAGHFTGKTIKTITVPFGYGKVKGDSGETAATATYDELSIVTGDDWLTSTVSTDTVTITHDFTAQDDTETKANKNNDSVNDNDSNAINKGVNDTLKLYTPIVDATGHVVGKNTETVILPYGFKTITVGTESTETSNVDAAAGNVVADNTQDILTINPGNKWIHIGASDTDNNDTITLSHEVNTITTTAKTDTDLNNGTDTITIQDTQYDNAGHVTHNQSHTYTLPFGYKTFTGDSGTTSADNTQDSMSVTGDNWVKTTVSEDNIAFAHIGPVEGSKTADTEPKPQFGNTFTFSTYDFDNKGHRYHTAKHSIKIPNITLTDTQFNGADVITQLTFTNGTDSTLVSTRTNIGNLTMTGYELPTSISTEALSASESLNSVLGKLEYRLNKEITDRITAIDNLDYTDTAVNGQYVSSVSQANGKISINRTNLPTYTLTSGSTNGTVAFNNIDVAVTGLGSAAYTNSTAYDVAGAASTAEQNAKDYADSLASNYATTEQGAKADSALQLNTQIVYNGMTKTVEELLKMIIDLQAQVNENHPVENTETTE